MASPVQSPQQLIEQAKVMARKAKALQQGVTVASGAVIGGPASSPPPATPSPPGASSAGPGGV